MSTIKAKEYYILIKKDIESDTAEGLHNAANTMFLGMNKELLELTEKRHVRFDRGMFSIIKELNDKWNAVVSLIEKDYAMSPILRDGYKKFWIGKIPGLEGNI